MMTAFTLSLSDEIASENRCLKENDLNILLLIGIVNDFVAGDVLDSLVAELEVFLDRHSVFDLQNHDWERNDQIAGIRMKVCRHTDNLRTTPLLMCT